MAKIHTEFVAAYDIGEVQTRLGASLARQRLARNWTQQELARRSGASLPTVQRIEAKGSGNIDSLLKIARVLGLLEDLLRALEDERGLSLDQRRQASTRTRARGRGVRNAP